jgi:hypothetical protein
VISRMLQRLFSRKREPSPQLRRAEEILDEVRSRDVEVDRVAEELRRIRDRNGLAPLIQRALRNAR